MPLTRVGGEGEIKGVAMADLVNLQEGLNAKRAEDAKYLERMDLTAMMIPVMVETVEIMGAERAHVIRFLQATIEELATSEWPSR